VGSDKDILAIIPARGGSKGIPRKNIKHLAGKPLIAYTIEHALKSERIDRVVVSTDDPEIASVSSSYGAEVVWRPEAISGDMVSSESALLHVLEHLSQKESYEPELIVFLQCTAPLINTQDITGTINAILETGADTALAVTNFHYFLWQEDKNGDATGINHDKNIRLLRQQRSPQYLEAGAVYVMCCKGFKKNKHRFFGRTVMHVIPRERCFEIDDMVDFQIAQILVSDREKHLRIQKLPEVIGAVVFDFDGVFTDNKVIVFENGSEAVICNRSDGLGLSLLKNIGFPLLVLSSEKNSVVQKRCNKLGIECINSAEDKVSILLQWLNKHNIAPATVVFIANDINDIECMKVIGCPIAVSDAHPSIRSVAQIVLEMSGGEGAVREVVDLILKKVGKGT